MSRSPSRAPAAPPAEARAQATVRVGRVVGADGGAPVVELPGGAGPVRARSVVLLDGAGLRAAISEQREVVLLLEEDDPRRPIIAGFLAAPSATPALDAALEATLAPAREAVEVEVDRERLVIEAREEVVLRCGEASLTLHRNGKVVIRGLHVETRAAGTNRIKGGTVKIN
ncbi:DUF6484 domain-containing protein [Anaeromyxobacter oryzisoli]|uniref:DUF6484 domain-containing protein n=1 Tax=Anaeromyxobacter oryzisoli TaxID=2925408 RepID=UPI001F56E572|nr:DUF6484 domain-containing protein [Anaeromyxobacter sp. SG63]